MCIRDSEQGVCVEGVPRHHGPDDGRGLSQRPADRALGGLQELLRANETKRDSHRAEAQVPRPQERRLPTPPCRLHAPPCPLARERQVELDAQGSGKLRLVQELRKALLDVVVPEVAPVRVEPFT